MMISGLGMGVAESIDQLSAWPKDSALNSTLGGRACHRMP